MDSSGRRFLETPDGQSIILVSDDSVGAYGDALIDDAKPSMKSKGMGFVNLISLYVSNLSSSALLYENVLGATVVRDPDLHSAICTWDAVDESKGTNQYLRNQVGIELVQISSDEIVDLRASQGSVTIMTNPSKLITIRERLKKLKTSAVNLSIAKSDELNLHGSNGVVVADDDGHIYRFITEEKLLDSGSKSLSKVFDLRFLLTNLYNLK